MFKQLIFVVSLLVLNAQLSRQQPLLGTDGYTKDVQQENLLENNMDNPNFSANQMLSLGNVMASQQPVPSNDNVACNSHCRMRKAFLSMQDEKRKSIQVNVSNPVLLGRMLIQLLRDLSWSFFDEADPDMKPLAKITIMELLNGPYENSPFFSGMSQNY